MSSLSSPWVLGISASHNGAACLLRGDEIVVAVQEERLTRVKRERIYGAQPCLAVPYCLEYAGLKPEHLSLVVVSVQGSAREQNQDPRRNPLFQGCRILTIPHHYAHAVSAFATSGFRESAALVVDGMGSPAEDLFPEERKLLGRGARDAWEVISLYAARDTSLVPLEKHFVDRGAWLRYSRRGMPRFSSLGGMYSAAAQQIFGNDMEAGKVMGLAPYGEPRLPTPSFFDISDGRFRYSGRVPSLFRHVDRWPLRQEQYEDLACSVQAALEEALFYLISRLRSLCPSQNLCYSGGVALNSIVNERIIRQSGFRRVHIVPAAEDSGPALGAAYHGLWQLTGENTRRRLIHDACGRPYSRASVARALKQAPGVRAARSTDAVADAVDLLCDGKVVGWFQGRSELGPRALGQRSILCDPRRPDAKQVLNQRVKKREAFRPFAPSILLERVRDWFELDGAPAASPFMLRVCPFRPEKVPLVPAVVHVDNTGRLQTLTPEANGPFYELVRKFYQKTGVPLLLNTSFNLMGEPIVETPEDALACLESSGLDCCIFEDWIAFREVAWIRPRSSGPVRALPARKR
jgi:carbamoyltransferase